MVKVFEGVRVVLPLSVEERVELASKSTNRTQEDYARMLRRVLAERGVGDKPARVSRSRYGTRLFEFEADPIQGRY